MPLRPLQGGRKARHHFKTESSALSVCM
uniref:Uncharacterized protein n=1 Tax=Anguilla anguilla TaxID=7936 RepID=A0A0E9TEE7_ANGAN